MLYFATVGHRIEIVEETSGDGILIAQVSDLHIGRRLGRVHRRTAQILNSIEPDILVITGDVFANADSLPAVGRWLDSLQPTIGGSYAILGNWEYSFHRPRSLLNEFYGDHGVKLLVNEIAEPEIRGRKIRLTGLDDILKSYPDLNLPGGASDGMPEVVLAHEPIAADLLKNRVSGVTILSGHTHGGQITPFGRILYTPKGSGSYVEGIYEIGGNRLIVSKGIGTSTVGMRIGPKPDIVLLTR